MVDFGAALGLDSEPSDFSMEELSDCAKANSVLKKQSKRARVASDLWNEFFSFKQKFTILYKVISIGRRKNNNVKKFVLTIFGSLLLILSSFTPLDVQVYKLRTIVIDAGHGGKDPGCSGKRNEEADIALGVALELGQILKKYMPDVKVIYTRSTDKFVELHERAKIANRNNADLFISIHCNSGPASAYGTETYIMGLHTSKGNLEVAKRENAVILEERDHITNYDGFNPNSNEAHIIMAQYQSAFQNASLDLAVKIEAQFKERVMRKSRGVKQAGLLVLWKTAMPSVLVEVGFLTNSKEEDYLSKKGNRELVASGIYRAIKSYKKELEKLN